MEEPRQRAAAGKTAAMAQGLALVLSREPQTTNTRDGLPEKIKFLPHRRVWLPMRNRWGRLVDIDTVLIDKWSGHYRTGLVPGPELFKQAGYKVVEGAVS